MNVDAINLGRSLFFGGGGGASVRYGTVRSVNAGRATVDVDGGLVEAPAMTCVPSDAAGRRCVVLAEGSSATVLGVLGDGAGGIPADVAERLTALELSPRIVDTGNSGTWAYRIWSDGTAECWKSFDADGKAFENAYGNAWFIGFESTLPFEFDGIPHSWVSVRTDTGGLMGSSFNDSCNAGRLGFYVYSLKHEASLNLRVQLYAIGKKKA